MIDAVPSETCTSLSNVSSAETTRTFTAHVLAAGGGSVTVSFSASKSVHGWPSIQTCSILIEPGGRMSGETRRMRSLNASARGLKCRSSGCFVISRFV